MKVIICEVTMGNKFTFVRVFIFLCSLVSAVAMGQIESKSECLKNSLYWDEDDQMCTNIAPVEVYGCKNKGEVYSEEFQTCLTPEQEDSMKSCPNGLCNGPKIEENKNNAKLVDSSSYGNSSGLCSDVPDSKAETHSTNDGQPEVHCQCLYPANGISEVKPQAKYGPQPACPTKEQQEKANKEKNKGSSSTTFACLASLTNQINACEEGAETAVQSCDQKSEKNKKVISPISQFLNGGMQVGQGAVNSLAQCQSVALTSATAGYALGQVQSNCKKDKSSCESTCNNLAQYKKVSAIEALCAKDTQAQADKEGLHSEASQLAATLQAAYSECNVSTQALLNSLGSALQTAMKASAATQQCQSVFGSKDQIVPPITNACISNPAAPGCPVNCASSSFASSPQCKCILNPNDSSCKGGQGPGKSTVASGSSANQSYNGIGAGSSGMPKINSDISGIKLDDEDVTDSSPTLPAETASAASNVAAQKASAPGGGSGGSSGSNKGEAATEAGKEEGGFLGATFKTLKNAANNLFGGRSGSSSKNNLNNKEAQNRTDYKKKAGIRGLASNANCYIDATGTEYCLNMGKRNRDIFQMINLGYSKQYHTLLVD